MKKIFKIFNEPFPDYSDEKQNFKEIVYIGIFITIFLFLFQPFGIHQFSTSKFIICIGFGIITIIAAQTYYWFVSRVLKLQQDVPSWTLGRWIAYMVFLLLYIAIWNFLYVSILQNGSMNLNWANFSSMVFSTLIVGAMPVTLSGIVIQIRAQQKNNTHANDLQSKIHHETTADNQIQLMAQNQKQVLLLSTQDLFCIEAMQNYVAVHYKEDGQMRKELIRSTLTAIEKQIEVDHFLRCHRSFIVNTQLIDKVEGNAQGLRLTLNGFEDQIIPVSRKYIPVLKEKLG